MNREDFYLRKLAFYINAGFLLPEARLMALDAVTFVFCRPEGVEEDVREEREQGWAYD